MLSIRGRVATPSKEEKSMLQKLAVVLSAAGVMATVACAESDPGITSAVKTKFAADDTVKAYQIDVDTQNRVVTLKGTVDSAAAETQAIALARTVDGVRDVVDQITVGPGPAATTGATVPDAIRDTSRDTTAEMKERGREAQDRASDALDKTGAVVTDAGVTTAVKSKFLADATVKGLQIDVDTRDGIVTLNGSVASKAEADRAATLARDTNGVKRVVNNLKFAK
jgi:hyperosmotically inducible protein